MHTNYESTLCVILWHGSRNSRCFTPYPVPLPCPQGYDILEDIYSPKTAAANLAHDLCEKKKEHLNKFMAAMSAIMQVR